MTNTLEQVQLEGHNRKVIAQQFCDDFTLVMMNDYEAYSELMADTKRIASTVELSDKLRDENGT